MDLANQIIIFDRSETKLWRNSLPTLQAIARDERIARACKSTCTTQMHLDIKNTGKLLRAFWCLGRFECYIAPLICTTQMHLSNAPLQCNVQIHTPLTSAPLEGENLMASRWLEHWQISKRAPKFPFRGGVCTLMLPTCTDSHRVHPRKPGCTYGRWSLRSHQIGSVTSRECSDHTYCKASMSSRYLIEGDVRISHVRSWHTNGWAH